MTAADDAKLEALTSMLETNETEKSEGPKNDRDLDSVGIVLQQDRYRKDTRHRLRLAWTVMGIIIVWLLFLMLVLVLNSRFFHLSDVVLVALLGTSTATVLGLPAIVLRGFFQYMRQTTSVSKAEASRALKRNKS